MMLIKIYDKHDMVHAVNIAGLISMGEILTLAMDEALERFKK